MTRKQADRLIQGRHLLKLKDRAFDHVFIARIVGRTDADLHLHDGNGWEIMAPMREIELIEE